MSHGLSSSILPHVLQHILLKLCERLRDLLGAACPDTPSLEDFLGYLFHCFTELFHVLDCCILSDSTSPALLYLTSLDPLSLPVTNSYIEVHGLPDYQGRQV